MVNYKPISLLTSFSKVFEKFIYERLQHHITINNTLVDNKFGFRTKSSTEKASFKLLNEILNAFNSELIVGGMFL
jgi:5-methylcytosine-specific restriction endonuclease McrBC regulatory subunit McrC